MSSPLYTYLILFSILFGVVYIYRDQYNYSILVFGLIFIVYFLPYIQHTNYLQFLLKTVKFNFNLQNGLLNIHPILIYIIYSYMMIYVYIRTTTTFYYLHVIFRRSFLIFANLIALIGIFLGALWASQELNWGGFWSWDPVELISLLCIYMLLKLLHNPNSIIKFHPLTINIAIFIFIYLIMRAGVVSTIHSFIKNTNTPFYVTFFCCISIFIFGSFIYFYQKFNEMYFFKKPLNPMSFKKWGFSIVLGFLIYHLFFMIFDSMLNSDFQFRLFNVIQHFTLLIFLCIYMVHRLLQQLVITRLSLVLTVSFLVSSFYYTSSFFIWLLIPVLLTLRPTVKHPILHLMFIYIYFSILFFFCDNFTWSSSFVSNMLTSTPIHNTVYNSTNIFYENFNFCINTFFTKMCKTYTQHILGLSLFSNTYITLFSFAKTYTLKFLFIEEGLSINILFIPWFFVFLLNYTNCYNQYIYTKY